MQSEDTSQLRNILLTGLPRSGTTLTCHLLNKIPNSVALHEPMRPNRMPNLAPEDVIHAIEEFFETQRAQILNENVATSKSSGGGVPSNPLADNEVDGQRIRVIDGRKINVANVDRRDFNLYMKHPSMFSACLPFLSPRMECFAAIRNPLSVLLSWRDANMAVTNGRVPAAERFDSELAASLDAQPDILRRQIFLIDYFFRRFATYLDGRVFKYEDVVATGGRALAIIDRNAEALDEPLSSRNRRAIEKDEDTRRIAEILIESDNACWSFYSREEVESLIN